MKKSQKFTKMGIKKYNLNLECVNKYFKMGIYM